jgi:lipid II:glycine glycyltransferase (peptidoglycan interpeptide bridge formation enzyme)
MAPPDQYKSFYDKRQETSGNKWFNIIPYEQFETLLRYITQKGRGNLFVATIGGEIVSGNVCLYDERNIIYLYGFSDRKFGNIWSHHYLKYKMFSRARDNGFLYCDLMGGAPTGFPEHPLSSVSEFKESLGWIKIEQYGSYDLVLNPVLYNMFKLYHKLRKK